MIVFKKQDKELFYFIIGPFSDWDYSFKYY